MNGSTQTEADYQIYFCGSMRGTTPNILNYQHLLKTLQKYGTVLTEHVAFPHIWAQHERDMNDEQIYEQDANFFRQANVMVAEVTAPSHGVGMELGWASCKSDFPVLCLSLNEAQFRTSALITGCPKFVTRKYSTTEEADEIISEFFSNLMQKQK